jgi:REP element-mobilizing transposase RayT
MEIKARKPLRKKEFDYSSNGLYFVTICVKNREKILCKIVGGGVLDAPITELTETGKKVEKYILSINNAEKVTVEKYVIMPDHIHLLLFIDNLVGTSGTPSPTNSVLSRTISGFKRLCNKEIGKPIWQRSFTDHIIRGEKDYLEHYRYIEENPILWVNDNK